LGKFRWRSQSRKESMSIPGYYSRINGDLLRLMPPDARVVLEVGSGTGALAEAYRRINPDVRYLGIEKLPAAAHEASENSRIDRMFTGDAAVVEPTHLGLSEIDPRVDCLVFGDVLEHMADPWTVLARLAQWVREGGHVLACIPNIQHYSVVLNLLRGKWEYRDEGLLDRTHLRFFTLEGMRELFAHAELKVFDIQPRWWPDASFDRFQQVMAPVLTSLGIDSTAFATQTRAVQYVVRAIRAKATPRRMVIWSLLGSALGSPPRVGEPAQFLTTIPGVRTLSCTGLQFNELDRTWPGEDKVFLQQRVVIPLADHLRLQRELLAREFLIVGEFDDDPQHFAELVRSDFFALRSCHCLQTTTEVMAETLRTFNPHVAVFPNQVAMLPELRSERGTRCLVGPLTIFFGALNREADWAPLMHAINNVLEKFGDQVRVQVVYDQAFFDALSTPHKVFEPLCSYERYHELLRSADIALLPLEPTRFNQHKSDLKFIECAAGGVVALASSTVYGQTVVYDQTGLVYQSSEQFISLLDRLIHDAPMRQRLAANAYCYVRENRLLARHFRSRYDWYHEMLDRRVELEAELRARMAVLT
jgi:SAM-dependent methyltransferase